MYLFSWYMVIQISESKSAQFKSKALVDIIIYKDIKKAKYFSL